MGMDDAVRQRVETIRRNIEAACRRSGRDPAEVTLVGASKTQPVERLQAAWRAGLRIFGENRVQEVEAKKPHLPPEAEWHLLGPLQSNKARLAVELFDVIQSVDRIKILHALERHAAAAGRRLPCFAEVLLGGEDSKHGFSPRNLVEALRPFGECEHLDLLGLMSVPPPGRDAEASRPWFIQLRRLRDEVAASGLFPGFRGWLSMGMSADYEVAIEEGATHVRVGTALFGSRDIPSGA